MTPGFQGFVSRSVFRRPLMQHISFLSVKFATSQLGSLSGGKKYEQIGEKICEKTWKTCDVCVLKGLVKSIKEFKKERERERDTD